MIAERYTVPWSPAHKLWLVYERKTGEFVGHWFTKAGANRQATEKNSHAT
jgi:hypothetical protein